MENILKEHHKDIHVTDIADRIREESMCFQQITRELQKVVIGNHEAIEMMLVSMVCNGHVLLEGVPGVAKTTMVRALAETLRLASKRIQFTPDLLPSDLIGTLIYNQKTADFETKFGPIFAHIIIADEINRAPAKVQSALLEAMQEQQVTIGNATYPLEKPFLVFATQNPLEHDGTYRLPEAQVDRFLCKLIIRYPSMAQEREILHRTQTISDVQAIITRDMLLSLQGLVDHIYVDNRIVDYILQLIFALREPQVHGFVAHAHNIACPPSPRATIGLYRASKARALVHRRHFVTPDDVKAIAHAVLRHRIVPTLIAESAGIGADAIITDLLTHIRAP